MKRVSHLKSVVLAGAAVLVLALSSNAAFAQSAPVLSNVVLKSHQDDLESMLSDMGKVQSPDTAKSYESYLNGQMNKYVGNHNALHHSAMPSFLNAKQSGKAPSDQVKVADAVDKLSDTHYPQLAAEMARVEKLNPGLKKNFDVLRTLN